MKRSVVLAFVIITILGIQLVGCGSSNFDIKGTWQSVGETGFGQAQPGAIVVFDGSYCNFYSPQDTYAITKENGGYILSVTSLLGQTLSYDIEVIDKNNIVVAKATLKRV